jgi:hypothetical protein
VVTLRERLAALIGGQAFLSDRDLEVNGLIDGNAYFAAMDTDEPYIETHTRFALEVLVVETIFPTSRQWRAFPFSKTGVEFRRIDFASPEWSDFRRHLHRVRLLDIWGADDGTLDLRFLAEARGLRVLAAPASVPPVDVSHLRLEELWGNGDGLDGVFGLTTLQRLALYGDFPGLAITAPIKRLQLNRFAKQPDFSMFHSIAGVTELTLSEGSWDLAHLKQFSGLRRLELYGCASLTNIGALADFPALQTLDIIDCRTVPGIEEFHQLVGLQVSVGGENVFDPHHRTRLISQGRSDWSFGSVPGSADGTQSFLVHPGLRRALRVPDEAGDDGPGEMVTAKWEKLDEAAQKIQLLIFADAILCEMTAAGAVALIDAHIGNRTPIQELSATDFFEADDVTDYTFVRENGDELGRITESIWNGFIVRSKRRPIMQRYRQ